MTETSIVGELRELPRSHPELVRASIGIGIILAASSSMRFSPGTGVYPIELSLLVRHLLSVAVVALALVLGRRRGWGFLSSRLSVALSVLFGIGMLASYSQQLFGANLGAVGEFLQVAREPAMCLLLLVWTRDLVGEGLRVAMAAMGLAGIVQGCLQLILSCFFPAPRMIAFVALPLVAAILGMLWIGPGFPRAGRTEGTSWDEDDDERDRGPGHGSGFGTARRLFALLVAIAFCMTFIAGHIIFMSLDTQQYLMGPSLSSMSIAVGNVAGGAFVVVAALSLRGRRACLILSIVALAAIAVSFYLVTFVSGHAVGLYLALSSVVSQIERGMWWLVAFETLRGASHERVLARYMLMMAVSYFARIFSAVFMILAVNVDPILYNVAVAVALLALVVSVLVLAQELASDDERGVVAYGTSGDLAGDASHEATMPFRIAVEEVGEEVGATRQEISTLALLARGYNAQRISETMMLSTNTVKSHMRNLYAKMEVHSQQEVIAIIDDRVAQVKARGRE